MKIFEFQLTMKDYFLKELMNEGKLEDYAKYQNVENVTYDFERSGYVLNNNELYEMEEWKTVANEELYEVNRKGEIRRKVDKKLLPFSKHHYSRVFLNKKINYYVHILVLKTFIGEDENPERNIVNHDDFDMHNNTLFNLYWVTQKENIQHYYKMSGKGIDYNSFVGKTYQGNSDMYRVIKAEPERYCLIIEFVNTGNQKRIRFNNFQNIKFIDNFYTLISPQGDRIQTRSLNILNKDFNIQGARFSEILAGSRTNYKGWTVERIKNTKAL
jgi:hypothetical protein